MPFDIAEVISRDGDRQAIMRREMALDGAHRAYYDARNDIGFDRFIDIQTY